jgi:signal transduction histidine kinase
MTINRHASEAFQRLHPPVRPGWIPAVCLSLVPAVLFFSGLALWISNQCFSSGLGLILVFAGFSTFAASLVYHHRKLSLQIGNKMNHIQLLDQQLLKMSRLAAATKLTRDFLTTLKDDLVNIDSSATIVQEQIRQDHLPDAVRDLEILKKLASTSCASIDKLLAVTRTPGNHWIIQDIQINDMITDILEILAPQFKEKQISITLNREQDLPMIRSNFSRVYQVFQNLFLTAVSDIVPDSRMTVITQSGPDGVHTKLIYPSRHFDGQVLARLSDPAYALQAQEPGPWLALCTYHVDRVNGWIQADETNTGLRLMIDLPFRIDRSTSPEPHSFLKGL